jgi:hypothetical protein
MEQLGVLALRLLIGGCATFAASSRGRPSPSGSPSRPTRSITDGPESGACPFLDSGRLSPWKERLLRAFLQGGTGRS